MMNRPEQVPTHSKQILNDTVNVQEPLGVGRGLLHHSDQGCTGEFNWSSQHLDDEVLRWRNGNGDGQTEQVGLRCVRPVARG